MSAIELDREFRTKEKDTPYGKIPGIPITLMNASLINKRIQIQMLINQ
jgi:hypothetical protein